MQIWKKHSNLIIIFILMLPLFFINIKSTTEWGGDFAHYIHQAKNITQGIPQDHNGYIVYEPTKMLGPKTYPVGFPLLLSPVYAIYGLNIKSFLFLVSFFLALAGIVTFMFLKRVISQHLAIISTVLFIYNPIIISYKGEVLADIPFTFFFILSIILILYSLKKRSVYKVLAGLVIGFTILIKPIAILLLIGLLLFYLTKIFRKKDEEIIKPSLKILFKDLLKYCFPALLIYLITVLLIFRTESEQVSFFASLFDLTSLTDRLSTNSAYYTEIFQSFFFHQSGKWRVIPIVIESLALTFFLLGFLHSLIRKIGYVDYVFILYLAVILTFPNATQGYRYLIPVTPVIFLYIIRGINLLKPSSRKRGVIISYIIGLIILLTYRTELNNIIKNQHHIPEGPYTESSQEFFRFIKTNTTPNDLIVFIKPRVLSLYGERDCMTNHPDQDVHSLSVDLQNIGADYYVLIRAIPNSSLERFVEQNDSTISLIWKNEQFSIFCNNR